MVEHEYEPPPGVCCFCMEFVGEKPYVLTVRREDDPMEHEFSAHPGCLKAALPDGLGEWIDATG
jgi:hypothetical protein